MRTISFPLASLAALLFSLSIPSSVHAAEPIAGPADVVDGCIEPEDCLRAAVASDAPGTLPPTGRVAAKLDRLRRLQERHPGSVWAKRGAILTGLLLLEQ